MYMNYITTTDLRTKSTELVESLKNGKPVSLIHRSKVVGEIVPVSDKSPKTIDAKKLQGIINRLDLPRLKVHEIDRRYRKAMEQKHGKGVR